jgi:hypothetical protein
MRMMSKREREGGGNKKEEKIFTCSFSNEMVIFVFCVMMSAKVFSKYTC